MSVRRKSLTSSGDWVRILLVSNMDKKNGKPTGRWRTDAFGAIALICGLIILFGLAAIVGGMP